MHFGTKSTFEKQPQPQPHFQTGLIKLMKSQNLIISDAKFSNLRKHCKEITYYIFNPSVIHYF